MTIEHQPRCTQIALNGNLIVPDHKPEIERILRITSTPVVTKTVVLTKKVVFSGHIIIGIEYVACVPGGCQPVHFVSFKIPFANFVEDPCAHPGLRATLHLEVEYQEFKAISKRCIQKLLILKICVLDFKDKCIDPCNPHHDDCHEDVEPDYPSHAQPLCPTCGNPMH